MSWSERKARIKAALRREWESLVARGYRPRLNHWLRCEGKGRSHKCDCERCVQDRRIAGIRESQRADGSVEE